MRFYDLLLKKRNGGELSSSEIDWLIESYVRDEIADYQMSAFCMAVYFQGMTASETTALTLAMAHSGDTIDLSAIPGTKVDKHSTGGVGDKTTLVLCSLVAACGVPVAKMSGRGLGHTGGTLDKLASIPGFSSALSKEAFIRQVQSIGLAVAGQTGDLAPADKRLYSLRDVTATVDSIPLIASSIMSKKLASGADAFVLDVKVGKGAFMQHEKEARVLAETMVNIGKEAGKSVVVYLSRMDEPLGYAVGNALEVKEAAAALNGQGPGDLVELCLTLGSEMLVLGKKAKSLPEARQMLQSALEQKAGMAKLLEMVGAQGGDASILKDLAMLPAGQHRLEVKAERPGFVSFIDSMAIGVASMHLGAGRQKKDDQIDLGAGILLNKKVGDAVQTGEILATLFSSQSPTGEVVQRVREAFDLSSTNDFEVPDIVIGRVG